MKYVIAWSQIQSTLRQPEVHILYIQFNVTHAFVLRCTGDNELYAHHTVSHKKKINKKRRAIYFDRVEYWHFLR